MIRLRGFRKQDLARLYQLDQVCFDAQIAYSWAQLQFFLNHPGCSCWIAEAPDSRLAGFVILERVSHDGAPAGHIVTLDVDPVDRRRGMGKLLMQTAESQIKQEGAGLMRLEVAENNSAARQFYRSLGYVARGRAANYYGEGVNAEIMEKVI